MIQYIPRCNRCGHSIVQGFNDGLYRCHMCGDVCCDICGHVAPKVTEKLHRCVNCDKEFISNPCFFKELE